MNTPPIDPGKPGLMTPAAKGLTAVAVSLLALTPGGKEYLSNAMHRTIGVVRTTLFPSDAPGSEQQQVPMSSYLNGNYKKTGENLEPVGATPTPQIKITVGPPQAKTPQSPVTPPTTAARPSTTPTPQQTPTSEKSSAKGNTDVTKQSPTSLETAKKWQPIIDKADFSGVPNVGSTQPCPAGAGRRVGVVEAFNAMLGARFPLDPTVLGDGLATANGESLFCEKIVGASGDRGFWQMSPGKDKELGIDSMNLFSATTGAFKIWQRCNGGSFVCEWNARKNEVEMYRMAKAPALEAAKKYVEAINRAAEKNNLAKPVAFKKPQQLGVNLQPLGL